MTKDDIKSAPDYDARTATATTSRGYHDDERQLLRPLRRRGRRPGADTAARRVTAHLAPVIRPR